jgi:hypothetical protein
VQGSQKELIPCVQRLFGPIEGGVMLPREPAAAKGRLNAAAAADKAFRRAEKRYDFARLWRIQKDWAHRH